MVSPTSTDELPTLLVVGTGEPMWEAIEAGLERHATFAEAAGKEAATAAAMAAAPDVILLVGDAAKDHDAVLKGLGEHPITRVVPVIILIDRSDLRARLDASRRGVTFVERSASADQVAREIAELCRQLPERSSHTGGELGETSLEEVLGILRSELQAGILSVQTGDDGARFVLRSGRQVGQAIKDFVDRIRPLVESSDGALRYDFESADSREIPLFDPAEDDDGDLQVFRSRRLILIEDDASAADTLAQELRAHGASVVVVTSTGSGLDRARGSDPELVLVEESGLDGPTYGVLQTLRRDPALRWASLLVIRRDELLPPGQPPRMERLAKAFAPLLAADEEIARQAAELDTFDTRLEALGPSRLLRALASAGRTIRATVRHPRTLVQISFAEGLIAGAEARRPGQSRNEAIGGPKALAALLAIGSGRVRVEARAAPATANVLAPPADALAQAARETPPIKPSMPPPPRMPARPSQPPQALLAQLEQVIDDLKASGMIHNTGAFSAIQHDEFDEDEPTSVAQVPESLRRLARLPDAAPLPRPEPRAPASTGPSAGAPAPSGPPRSVPVPPRAPGAPPKLAVPKRAIPKPVSAAKGAKIPRPAVPKPGAIPKPASIPKPAAIATTASVDGASGAGAASSADAAAIPAPTGRSRKARKKTLVGMAAPVMDAPSAPPAAPPVVPPPAAAPQPAPEPPASMEPGPAAPGLLDASTDVGGWEVPAGTGDRPTPMLGDALAPADLDPDGLLDQAPVTSSASEALDGDAFHAPLDALENSTTNPSVPMAPAPIVPPPTAAPAAMPIPGVAPAALAPAAPPPRIAQTTEETLPLAASEKPNRTGLFILAAVVLLGVLGAAAFVLFGDEDPAVATAGSGPLATPEPSPTAEAQDEPVAPTVADGPTDPVPTEAEPAEAEPEPAGESEEEAPPEDEELEPEEVEAADAEEAVDAEEHADGEDPEAEGGAPRTRAEQLDALVNAGNFFRGRRRYALAERRYESALRMSPSNARALTGIALVSIAQRKPNDAVRYARRLVRARSGSAGARVILGDALALDGDRAGARREYRKALELNPRHSGARRRLR
ncbi:MAG: hypothetical protein CMN30_16780 [Sandaracinus sp.]|nr:hypothetical protein [Sandaracinus sp.]